jgi:D-amino-acid dehydrogenase
MHIVVLGAGVIGVTTAWYLAEAGHRVTVLEKNESAGHGTSYANAAQISPALSSPWAFPGLVGKAMSWMFEEYPPLILSRMPDAAMSKFLWRMWRASSVEKYVTAKRDMVLLAEYSRDCSDALRDTIGIQYAGRQKGLIVAFREQAQADGYARDLSVLDQLGVPHRNLGRDELMEREPNLDPDSGLIGGVLLETDQTGDCFLFTQALAAACAARGVSFLYGQAADKLLVERERVLGVVTDKGETIEADGVVVALGVWSKGLLAPHGIDVPIYPVKGYSLTVRANSDEVGPISTVSDESRKVGLTSLDDRIRIGGTAELAGYDFSRPEKRYAGLLASLRALFPKVPEEAIASAERWSGRDPLSHSLPEQRPWNAWLDHGLRLGPRAGRPDLRPSPGGCAGALRAPLDRPAGCFTCDNPRRRGLTFAPACLSLMASCCPYRPFAVACIMQGL